jgi:deoxycytidylate deaminase
MRGPCAKRRVQCLLQFPGLAPIFGENDCANPQPVCPRLPGEDYTKCSTVCQQAGHAEMVALKQAEDWGLSVAGWKATIRGHHYFCEDCGKALKSAGIAKITVAHDEGDPNSPPGDNGELR